jgi:hypothetical protein
MKIASPLTLNLTDTRAFKIWLYQLWQGVGGDTDIVTTIVNNYAIQKQTIVNIGSSYVLDKVVNVVDADVKTTSIIECSIAPVADGYTRPVEEVIYERIMVYATPKNGSIDFYLQPERGHFKGEFAINYMVKK